MRKGKGGGGDHQHLVVLLLLQCGWRRILWSLLLGVLICLLALSWETLDLLALSPLHSAPAHPARLPSFPSVLPSHPARLRSRARGILVNGTPSPPYRLASFLPQDHALNQSAPLQRLARLAAREGRKAWEELLTRHRHSNVSATHRPPPRAKGIEPCSTSILKSREELLDNKNLTPLPCGLVPGSSVTVIGKPLPAQLAQMPGLSRSKTGSSNVMVSHFVLELQGLLVSDGEDPPRILHINPRLKGDWSNKPVIEMNTGYRGQWGRSQRCDGSDAWNYEDTVVDGIPRCEKWVLEDDKAPKEIKVTSWLDRLIGNTPKHTADWQYPFKENASFVLTIRAGWEGYHMSVDGRHIASFPYRTGFILEEATGLYIKGDVDVVSVTATALPSSRSRVSAENLLEASEKWRAPKLPKGPVELFIGILSAASHFTERMAVRKTWFQTTLITSSKVVARFFVALHSSEEVNVQLKAESDYYGDIIILPFIDHYELLVLKTVAICEYGVQNLSAKYIMKCDDDNFVRVEAVLNEVKETQHDKGLYMGNINLNHRPLRAGKWAVTYEEWSEETYPPYANGPGYVISSDIAEFIVSEHKNQRLWLFKMEDVSMGAWVGLFSAFHDVYTIHNRNFCQFGCVEGYLTSHYQSPHQMLCMWEKLRQGKAQCCSVKRL